MIKNNFVEKLSMLASFFSKHFRLIVFMSFVGFLFYIAMLGIEISSAVNHVPSVEDINKKIQSVSIRKDLIKKIDNYILARQKKINSQIFKKNPFLPYQKGTDAGSNIEPTISPEITYASPAVSPTNFPSISPAVSP